MQEVPDKELFLYLSLLYERLGLFILKIIFILLALAIALYIVNTDDSEQPEVPPEVLLDYDTILDTTYSFFI
jgi:hypothetical protein